MDLETITLIESSWFCPNCSKKMFKSKDEADTLCYCKECGCQINIEEIGYLNKPHGTDKKIHEKIDSGRSYVAKLFNPRFMKKFTKFENFNEFILSSDLIPKSVCPVTYDIFKKIPKDKLDQYVRTHTRFQSWDEMFDSATSKFLRC